MESTRNMVVIAVLSAIAAILMFLEFPLPFFPPFLQIDLGDVPAILAAFALGPVSGISVELIKSVVHIFATKSVGIGEIASFVCGAVFVVISGAIYHKKKSRKNAVAAMLLSTAVTSVVASLVNLYFLLPVYEYIMGIDEKSLLKIASIASIKYDSLNALVAFAVFPFNVIKWLIASVIVYLTYKRLSRVIHRY